MPKIYMYNNTFTFKSVNSFSRFRHFLVRSSTSFIGWIRSASLLSVSSSRSESSKDAAFVCRELLGLSLLRSADKVGRPFCCCIVFSLFLLLLLFYFFPTICVLRFLCYFSSDLSDIWPVDR